MRDIPLYQADDVLQNIHCVLLLLYHFQYNIIVSVISCFIKPAERLGTSILSSQPLLFSDWQADGTEDGMELEFIDASVEKSQPNASALPSLAA